MPFSARGLKATDVFPSRVRDALSFQGLRKQLRFRRCPSPTQPRPAYEREPQRCEETVTRAPGQPASSSRLSTLPVALRRSSSTTTASRGTLYDARCRFAFILTASSETP